MKVLEDMHNVRKQYVNRNIDYDEQNEFVRNKKFRDL